MKYYITTCEVAKGISALEATNRGCTGTTSFWWSVICGPGCLQAAIVFSDDEAVGTIYQSETITITDADLVDELPEGWD